MHGQAIRAEYGDAEETAAGGGLPRPALVAYGVARSRVSSGSDANTEDAMARAADDFDAIRARMEELRRERARTRTEAKDKRNEAVLRRLHDRLIEEAAVRRGTTIVVRSW